MECPKCNNMLHDTTLVCVYCGYVLNNEHEDSRSLCDMRLKRINDKPVSLAAEALLRDCGVPKKECYPLLMTAGNTVLTGIYKGNAPYLYDKFLRYGYEMELVPAQDEYVNPVNSVIEDKLREKGERIADRQKNKRCPRCTSSDLQIDRISPFFNGGFRWKQHCRNCGYTWKVE